MSLIIVIIKINELLFNCTQFYYIIADVIVDVISISTVEAIGKF